MTEALGVTAHIRYVLDPNQLEAFEQYAREWIRLVPRFGGVHHGYFLPSEGANNGAYALFSFPSLAAYERYRIEAEDDAELEGSEDGFQPPERAIDAAEALFNNEGQGA